MVHPKNPIVKSGMFATPDNFRDLENYCMQLSQPERSVAITVLGMTMNWASGVVDKVLNDVSPNPES
jgi:hypothetical protein